MKLSTAKFKLYNTSPFFGSILFNLPVIEDEKETPTLGVDGRQLYINPKYWQLLSKEQQLGVLIHEIAHLFLGHIWRKKDRNEVVISKDGQAILLWNLATDYVVNLLIRYNFPEHKIKLPQGALLDIKYKDWSAERIYEDLRKTIPKLTQEKLKQIIIGSFSDKSKWGKGSKQEQKQQERRMKQIVQTALQHQKNKGNVPAFLERLVKELEPKEDWRLVLMEYAQRFQSDYSFNPADRRFLENDFILPDIQEGEKLDWIAIAVDTSGSISERELERFLGEVKGILKAFDKVKAKVTFCDAQATEFVELEEYEPKMLKPKGGGGTDFRPVFKLIEKSENFPQVLVYFTDLMGSFPSRRPKEYDIIWVRTTNEKAPFGKILDYDFYH